MNLFVPGNPQPWQRVALVSKGRARPHMFTPDETRAWEKTVGLHARAARSRERNWPSFSDALFRVELRFTLPDRRRRDLDNLAKAVLDGCNKVLWHDDAQVAELHIVRILKHPRPGVMISVTPIDEPC